MSHHQLKELVAPTAVFNDRPSTFHRSVVDDDLEPDEKAYHPPLRKTKRVDAVEEEEEVEKEEKKKAEKVVVVERIIERGTTVHQLFLMLLFFIATALTVPVIVHMTVNQSAVLESIHSVFVHRQPVMSQSSKISVQKTGNEYPLWLETHDTKSAPLSMSDPKAKPLISTLENSFRVHMEMGTQYSCLCMHHLKVPHTASASYQVCGIYNRPRRELYVMVNPTLVGRSNQTDHYTETSVSCPTGSQQSTTRSRIVFLQWVDPETNGVLYSKFAGIEAVCMQVAMDEMSGNKHCQK